MHFNVNHPSQCDVKACVVPPSSSHTIQSSVHVHRKCRVGFMFTRSAVQGSCSQEVQSRVHVHKKCRVGFMFTKYRVVFTFTINMEQCSCSQNVLSIQLVFMNKRSALYNSCLQTELLRYVYKKQFKVVFMFTHALLVRDKIIKRFQNTIATFLCFKNAFILAFPQMCVQYINLTIRSGMVEAQI